MLIEEQLASILAHLVKVWHYQAASGQWELYDPAAPASSNLTALLDGEEYDIQVTQACTLSYRNDQYHYDLQAGWNHLTWQQRTLPPPPPPPVEITSVAVAAAKVARGGQLEVTVWLSVREPLGSADLAVLLMQPPDYGTYQSLAHTGYRRWPTGSYSQALTISVSPEQSLGTNQVNANLYSASGTILALNYQTRVEVTAAPPAPPPGEITQVGIPPVVSRGDAADVSVEGTINAAFPGRVSLELLEPPGYTQGHSSLRGESRAFSPPAFEWSGILGIHPENALGANRLRAQLLREETGQAVSEKIAVVTVTEKEPTMVEITSVAASPGRVSRGGKLQVTTWLSVTEAFAGYLSVSLLEPPGYTGYQSSASTPILNWAAGSYSVPLEVTVNSENSPGVNRVRATILGPGGTTLAEDLSQTVEVTEEVISVAGITRLDVPAEVKAGGELPVRVQGTVSSVFEGYFNAVLLEPPDHAEGRSTGGTPLLGFSPPSFDSPFALRVRRDNAVGLNRLRVRLISANEILSETTSTITVGEAATPPPVAEITTIEAPPQVRVGEELQIRIKGTVTSPLTVELSLDLLGPPDYRQGPRWSSPALQSITPPSFDLGARVIIPRTQPAGVNRLVATMLQENTPIAEKAVSITVKAAEGPPTPPPTTPGIVEPMMGLMMMGLMMGSISPATEGEGGSGLEWA